MFLPLNLRSGVSFDIMYSEEQASNSNHPNMPYVGLKSPSWDIHRGRIIMNSEPGLLMLPPLLLN